MYCRCSQSPAHQKGHRLEIAFFIFLFVATLEMICKGFGITLAQFFAEGSMVELTEEQQTMFEAWRTLSPEQKDAISHLISVMKK